MVSALTGGLAIVTRATPSSTSMRRSLIAHLHERLPEILTVEEANECLGRGIDTLRDILAVTDAALLIPTRHIAHEVGAPVGVIAQQKPSNGQSTVENREPVWTT